MLFFPYLKYEKRQKAELLALLCLIVAAQLNEVLFLYYPALVFEIFLQVNTGKEKTKSGIFPEDTKDFLFFLRQEMKLPIIGLMCIPPIDDDPGYHFNKLKLLANENNIDELSIGMSDDYEKALQFNPTYIRLGTILFGKRS